MGNRLQQVRLAQPDVAVQKQGVIGLARFFRHWLRHGVRQAITRTNDEGIEGIAWGEGRRGYRIRHIRESVALPVPVTVGRFLARQLRTRWLRPQQGWCNAGGLFQRLAIAHNKAQINPAANNDRQRAPHRRAKSVFQPILRACVRNPDGVFVLVTTNHGRVFDPRVKGGARHLQF